MKSEIKNLSQKEKEQHFLINEDILKKEILISKIKNTENVLEIGAGDGRLTRLIAKRANFVLTFEKDFSLKKSIEKNLSEFKNIKIIYDNALKYSWRNFYKIISNIPYSLSGPILEKAIQEDIQEMILIVGENFKKKLESQEKIGLIANLFFDINFLLKITNKDFYPIPRTDSWLIHFKRKKDKDFVDITLRNIFLSERKIKNALIYSLLKEGFTKKEIKLLIKNNLFNTNSLNKKSMNITKNLFLKIRDFLNEINQKDKIKL